MLYLLSEADKRARAIRRNSDEFERIYCNKERATELGILQQNNNQNVMDPIFWRV